MKIKLSKSQWEAMGKKAGWVEGETVEQIKKELADLIDNPAIPMEEKIERVEEFATRIKAAKKRKSHRPGGGWRWHKLRQIQERQKEEEEKEIDALRYEGKSSTKIKLSRSQWESAGKKAGWITASQDNIEAERFDGESDQEFRDRLIRSRERFASQLEKNSKEYQSIEYRRFKLKQDMDDADRWIQAIDAYLSANK